MKTVLITGGSRGIGLKTVERFLANKHKVFSVATNFSKSELKDKKLTQIEFDLSDIDNLSALKKQVGDIDILVNNAGIMNALPFDRYDSEKKEKIRKINLEVPIELINLFSKGMIEKGEGRIVNVASIAGHIGHPDIWYGTTKAGIINMTKSYAKILGPKGIVVNCVAPGPVETDMMKTIPTERIEEMKKGFLTGRVAKPEEIAETIYWLSIESPEYINGVCIDINNGTFMR